MDNTRLITRYKEKGFRLTPQRIAILEFLEGNRSHPSAEDIFKEIKKQYPTISFATVYNTIQGLRDTGLLMEIIIDSDRRRYDPDTINHHHVICTRCNKIGDINEDYSKLLKLPDDVAHEFDVSASHVNFYAICRECSALH